MAQDARIFIEYCKYGNIEGIKLLPLIYCDLNWGFLRACKYGHYNIVLYLVELYKTGNPNDNITDVNNYEKIDIHLYNEVGFRMACENGNYMIVKYLVELYKTGKPKYYRPKYYSKINIHSCNEEGLYDAYVNEHYNIVKYLMTLYKKHKYIYEPIDNYLIIFDKFNKYKL